MKKIISIARMAVIAYLLISCDNKHPIQENIANDEGNDYSQSNNNKVAKNQEYIPQLGDIGDLFGGGDVGDPPICSTFEDIEKWGQLIKTNDDEIIEGIDVGIYFLSTGDKIRIIELKDTKWVNAFQFRILNGENKGKVAWGMASNFRLIKSKLEQDKEGYEQGE
jgi:hypothetical protein